MPEQSVSTQEEKKPEIGSATETKKKSGFWGKFVNFLAMGGFIVVIIAIIALVVVISMLFNCK